MKASILAFSLLVIASLWSCIAVFVVVVLIRILVCSVTTATETGKLAGPPQYLSAFYLPGKL
jgi:hypothetical protein